MRQDGKGPNAQWGGAICMGLGALAAGALSLAAAMAFLSQVLHFMRAGEWIPLPAWRLFSRRQDGPVLSQVPELYVDDGFVEWLFEPRDWIGTAHVLRAVLESLHASVLLFCAGLLALLFFGFLALEFEKAARRHPASPPH